MLVVTMKPRVGESLPSSRRSTPGSACVPRYGNRQETSCHHTYAREAIPGSVRLFTEEQQHEESAPIPIVDSSLGPLGVPEFAGSAATHDLANHPDNHHHDFHRLICHVKVRN